MTRQHESVSKIEMVGINDLIPYEKNPRKHTDKNIDVICDLIIRDGFVIPILIDQKNRIIAGHGRLLAAKKLNRAQVPCVRVQTESDQHYINMVISDNKAAELSKWDNKLLKECLDILGPIEKIDVIGFTDDEIDKIFGFSHKEVHQTREADFGDAGGVKVESEVDDRALVKRKIFMFTKKEHKFVTNKLLAIKKENGLDNEAEALIKALEPYKGLPKVIKKAGPVTEIDNRNGCM